MITMHVNGASFHFDSLLIAEREALSHLQEIHARVMRARSRARRLEGLLYALPFCNRIQEQAAHLRQEARVWHDIRRAATHARLYS
ncbi:MAG: hypothetical protein HQL97_12075 [Magnetococcales bacterium]|nr:hypothetical protein [Magnetococcales bacterium]MBF0262555.1 hypothetical protein [Magnetococcales bacterium]